MPKFVISTGAERSGEACGLCRTRNPSSALRFALLTAPFLFTVIPILATTITGIGLNNTPIVLAPEGTTAVVLVFVASDCPISNRYFPELNRIAASTSKGVRFYLVYPNSYETTEKIRQHQQEFNSTITVLRDPAATLTSLAQARVTPEAAVLVSTKSGTLRLVYHGRIDNRYVAFGQERPTATSHDLSAAIDAALQARPVPPPSGPPIGCAIVHQP